MPVRLDLNNPEFQRQWFGMEKAERIAVLSCLTKVASMDWAAVYADRGLRWEAIQSRTGPDGERLYSIRVSRAMCAVVRRQGEFLRLLSLHPDHDSAYE